MSNTGVQARWASKHDHVFDQDKPTANERRTIVVVLLTAVTMVVEIAAGLSYGSMALLADGLHMASHPERVRGWGRYEGRGSSRLVDWPGQAGCHHCCRDTLAVPVG